MQVSSFACCWRYRAGELSCRTVALATDTLKNTSNLPQNRFLPLGWIVVPPEPRNALRGALKREIKILWILTHTLSCPKTCLLPHQTQHRNTATSATWCFVAEVTNDRSSVRSDVNMRMPASVKTGGFYDIIELSALRVCVWHRFCIQ